MTLPFLLQQGPDLQRFSRRILFVASPGWLPARSEGGSPMIGHALTRAFSSLGYGVAVVAFLKTGLWPGAEVARGRIADAEGQSVQHWFFEKGDPDQDAGVVTSVLASTRPDIVFCFGPDSAAAVREPGSAVKITSFYDPPHLPAVYKRLVEWRYGDLPTRLRCIRNLPRTWRRWREQVRTMLPALAGSDVVIGHAANHAASYARRLGRTVHNFANPLENVQPPRRCPLAGPPAFLLAGNVGSTVSLAGLSYLCLEVLPHLAGALERGDLQIRIVGGGKLPRRLERIVARHPNIHVLGHVEESRLLREIAGSAALLVPTPIPLGFRTRIVDAFRQGLPTIVHAANQAGFADLEHRRNCWMATNARDFAGLVLAAAADPASLRSVATRAREEFERHYAADVFCRSVLGLAAAVRERDPARFGVDPVAVAAQYRAG